MTQQLQSLTKTSLQAWTSIDFMSVTMPYVQPDTDVTLWQEQARKVSTHPDVPVWANHALETLAFVPAKSRKGHSAALHEPVSGATVFMGGSNSVSVFEAGGRACKKFSNYVGYKEMARMSIKTCTRIDVAIDFDLPPADIASYVTGWSKRIKAHSWVNSPSGQTLYLGSPTSERFARIYRYAEPHPRARFLRVEIVSRRKHAKAVCEAIQTQGLGATASALLAGLSLQGSDFRAFENTNLPVTPLENNRSAAKRVLWILKQVTPALIDMHKNGELDAYEWFKNHVESGIE